jgi:hypothetical protein
MSLIRETLDRIVLVAAVVAAGCVPSFVAQYRQRIGGMLDQVLKDLAPFQEIADKLHHGSLQALIQHHMESSDPTFYKEGAAVRAMVEASERLQSTIEALNTDLYHQLSYLAAKMDPAVAQATWDVFSPSFQLTPENAVFALIIGFTVWLAFLIIWYAADRLTGILMAR